MLRRQDLRFSRDPAAQALDGAGVRHFARARYALHAAYRAAGVGAQGALLAPAYHCRTMLDPALALGAEVLLYPVDERLAPDLASVAALLALAQPPVKAVVLTHYFGFRQPQALMDALAALCREHGATLVEDCSHAWQIALEHGPACETQAWRMVVASPYKFCASPDGGTLWGGPARLARPAPARPGVAAELKALAQALARARRGAAVGAGVAAVAPSARGTEHTETGALISSHYQPDQEQNGGFALSRWITRHSRVDAATGARRANYLRWVAATAGLPGARPLYAELPPDCSPYMFPLLLASPDPHFFRLKQMGMPVWRWDDMAVSGCAVATRMRLHLLHLPCHQSLSEAQMAWMTSSVVKVVSA